MRIAKSLDTKLTIFRAAVDLLDEEDLDAISIRGIAKRAEVSVGTFYYYFNTKYEVFGYAHIMMGAYMTSTVAKNLPKTTTWDRLMFLFDQYHNFIVKQTPKKLHQALGRLDPAVSQRGQDETGLERIVQKLLDEGKEKNEVFSDKPSSDISFFLMSCIRGFYRQYVIMDDRLDANKIITEYIPILVAIFVKKPDSPQI